MSRDKCNQQQAEAKVAAQMPLHIKETKAQLVIDNSKDFEHVKIQVLSARVLSLIQSPPPCGGAITTRHNMLPVCRLQPQISCDVCPAYHVHSVQVQKLVISLQPYRWLGMMTSPPVLMGFFWLAIKMIRQ